MNTAAKFLEYILAEWKWDSPHTPLSSSYYPFCGIACYLLGIVALKAFMRERQAMILKGVQVVYNVAMVALSISMLTSMVLAAWGRAQRRGVMSLICEQPEDVPYAGAFGFVIYVFYLSKYIELLDTVFLILRKKPVIPLHIFHHGIMLFATWSWLDGSWISGAWWCVFVNSLVHSFMYYYYLLSSLGYNVWWKQMLTGGQIVQFWTGFFLVSYWYYIRNEEKCLGGLVAATFSHAGNIILIVMFVRFFITTYGKKEGKQE